MNQPPEPSYVPAIVEAPSSGSQIKISVTEATPPSLPKLQRRTDKQLEDTSQLHKHFLPFGWFGLEVWGVFTVLKAARAQCRKRTNGFQICSGTTRSSPSPKCLWSHCVPTLCSQSRPQQSWRKMAALTSSSPVWSLNKVE